LSNRPLRRTLARLFDPNDEVEDRKLVFRFRFRRQRPGGITKDRAIAYYYEQETQKGRKPDSVVEAARTVFGTNGRKAARSTITDALARDRKRNPEFIREIRSDRRSGRT
jgi:hypothetical protein